MLKMNLLLYFQANCKPNFPEKKQIFNFLDIFFQRLLKVKKIEKKIFFQKKFLGGVGCRSYIKMIQEALLNPK